MQAPPPGLRERQLQALPQGVVVVAEEALTFQQRLEPLGELALKNPRQINDQLVQLRQLLQAPGQLLAGGRQGRGRLRGWGWAQARGTRDPCDWLVRGGWLLQGGRGTGTIPIFARTGTIWCLTGERRRRAQGLAQPSFSPGPPGKPSKSPRTATSGPGADNARTNQGKPQASTVSRAAASVVAAATGPVRGAGRGPSCLTVR